MQVILAKYDELWLKSEKVKKRMISYLVEHLKFLGFKKIKVGREGIKILDVGNTNKLKVVPGISKIEMREVYKFEGKDELINVILRHAQQQADKFKTFGIRVKRKYKGYDFNSRDVEREAGSLIVNNLRKKVNLRNPDLWIRVEIYKGEVHIIAGEQDGMGGLPYGCEGSCEIREESYYLIKEVIKRGLYIINLPSELRKLYPFKQYSQDFKVVFYASCFEDLNEIKNIGISKKGMFYLFPFVALTKKEFLKYEQETREFFKSLVL